MGHIIDFLLLLAVIFVTILVVSQLLLFFYLYVENSLGQLEDPDRYPYASNWRYIKNFFREFAYVSSKYFLYPWKFFDLVENLEFLESQETNNRTVVLLVHGYGRAQTDWLWFLKHAQDIPCPLFTINLTPALGPIQQIAHGLANKIDEIKNSTQCENIILIGHSMGGLVSSYYAENLDQDHKVKAIMTLGTPFAGTKISVAGVGANVKQMLPNSNFLEQLVAKIKESNIPYYQVLTKLDNIIFPWDSAVLEFTPQDKQMILDLETHQGLMYNREVIQQLKTWVEELLSN